jgi:hypothetical protein
VLPRQLRFASDEGYLLGTSVAKGEKCESDVGNGILGKHAFVLSIFVTFFFL